ncbi:MAG TPA: twin-arginine translocation signal domain-containing protein, partial [Vicinamibacterales bacterium]|nr:twin-arginine translocation signal domain-containing protein [Vicinamibacterales bacterium]
MLIKRPSDVRSSEITDKKLYVNRREFIRASGVVAAAGAAGALGAGAILEAKGAPHGKKLPGIKKGVVTAAGEKINAWEDITSYNNYYEFGQDKDDPVRNVGRFKTEPWTVTVEGECNKKGVMNLEDVLK